MSNYLTDNDKVFWRMLTNLVPEYYLQQNINYSYQNGSVPSSINDYVIITRGENGQDFLPLDEFDPELQQKTLTSFDEWDYQVDFYGDNSDAACTKLQTYLNSAEASDYLLPDNLAVGHVGKSLKMTNENDRANYMKRYLIQFTLLNTAQISFPLAGVLIQDVIDGITIEEIL